MKKIVLFDGDIETQAYFTYRIRDELERLGHETFTFDVSEPVENFSRLIRFVEPENTAVISFNFHGLTPGEIFRDDGDGEWFWDGLRIPCYNIVVDHPFYYHKFLECVPKGYVHISIDRFHDAYMKEYFPHILRIPFLPLAGTELSSQKNEKRYKPIRDRKHGIVFTGNYSSPHKFDQYIERNGKEYADFYHGMIDDLLSNPWKRLEDVAKEHLQREIPEVTFEELKETMSNLIFIDLYIRSEVRGKAVQSLIDSGLKVEVYGDGWDELECKHPENLINAKGVDSLKCLEMIADSKVSLNVMPWFKDGAHDRVFNTMLNGALLLTDSSLYMDEFLKDGENSVVFRYDTISEMPEKVKRLLEEEDKLQAMADRAYRYAAGRHTWAQRADFLSALVEENLITGVF